jgi:hypothetical protein
MLTEWLTGVHVGNVYFDKWDINTRQCIPDGDAGVGEGTWVDQDERCAVFTRGMNTINQHVLCVALKLFQLESSRFRDRGELCLYVGKGGGAIDMGLSRA